MKRGPGIAVTGCAALLALSACAGGGAPDAVPPVAGHDGDAKPAAVTAALSRPARDCGSVLYSASDQAIRASVAPGSCFSRGVRDGEAARLTWRVSAIEWIDRFHLRSRPDQGDVLVLRDTTNKPYGDRGWHARGCQGVPKVRLAVAHRLPIHGCSEEIRVNARTPPELIDRRTLASCGRVGAGASRGRLKEGFRCLRRTPGGAELVHVEAAEEHPRVRFIRIVDAGIEVFEHSGGYSPSDHRWSQYACARIKPGSTEPQDCEEPRSLGEYGPG